MTDLVDDVAGEDARGEEQAQSDDEQRRGRHPRAHGDEREQEHESDVYAGLDACETSESP